MTRDVGRMLSEKSQRTQNGTMFVDLDGSLNASRRLSASAELLAPISFVRQSRVDLYINEFWRQL